MKSWEIESAPPCEPGREQWERANITVYEVALAIRLVRVIAARESTKQWRAVDDRGRRLVHIVPGVVS